MTPDYWNTAKRVLAKRDPILRAAMRAHRGEGLQMRGEGFQTLARAIVGQQISVKAAASIWNRLLATVDEVTPDRITLATIEQLRGCGLSQAKALYLQSLASYFLENSRQIRRWPKMDDEAVVAELITIKGIGRWTAEMFLIFAMGRPDVFPLDDVGLLRGIHRHYNGGEKLTRPELAAIGDTWRPYRSLGTWYMWRALDPEPVVY